MSCLRSILPPLVSVAETRGDVDYALYADERRFVAGVVTKRRLEFTTVRWCAAQALRELGYSRPVQVPGDTGEPAWPNEVVGSMTHCRGYRAAVAASAHAVDAIGIDAEPNENLPAGVLGQVASRSEAEQCLKLSAQQPEIAFDRLLFSAKESVFKAWFPREKCWLDFGGAEIVVSPSLYFEAWLRTVKGHMVLNEGLWCVKDGLVVTALLVPAGQWPAQ